MSEIGVLGSLFVAFLKRSEIIAKISKYLHSSWLLCLQVLFFLNWSRDELSYWAILPDYLVIYLLLLLYLIIVYTLTLRSIAHLFHFLKLVNIRSIFKTTNSHWFCYSIQERSLSYTASAFQHKTFTIPTILYHSYL